MIISIPFPWESAYRWRGESRKEGERRTLVEIQPSRIGGSKYRDASIDISPRPRISSSFPAYPHDRKVSGEEEPMIDPDPYFAFGRKGETESHRALVYRE